MYPNGQGSNIGTLLRLIQEDKNQSVAATSPSSDPNSPIRSLNQQPIQAPNDPNSSRVVSLRPEGVTQSGPQAEAQPNVVAPIMPVAPQAPTSPVAPQAPNNPGSSISSNPTPSFSSPSIGTRISSAPAPTGTSRNFGASTLGISTYKAPTPTKSITPSTSKVGGSLGAIGGTTAAAAKAKGFNIGDALSNVIGGLPKFGPAATVSTAFLNPALKSGLFNTLYNTITGNKPKSSSTRI